MFGARDRCGVCPFATASDRPFGATCQPRFRGILGYPRAADPDASRARTRNPPADVEVDGPAPRSRHRLGHAVAERSGADLCASRSTIDPGGIGSDLVQLPAVGDSFQGVDAAVLEVQARAGQQVFHRSRHENLRWAR